ncbi:MAG: hypothetical protein ACTS8P_04565 [Arsenophonus sp. NC-XBC3-MAG3]
MIEVYSVAAVIAYLKHFNLNIANSRLFDSLFQISIYEPRQGSVQDVVSAWLRTQAQRRCLLAAYGAITN